MAKDVPFDAVVTRGDVQARSGAGPRYYVVGNIEQGQRVRVDEVFYGWNKIVCPPGIFSYISKAFVDAKGDGKTGIVNGDGQVVKAASIKGPGESYRTQAILNQGDVVTIVEEQGSFYKIIPPKGAYVFLPPGSVQRTDDVNAIAEEPATSEEPVTVEEPSTEPAQPATDTSAEQPAGEETPSESVAPDEQQPVTDPELLVESGKGDVVELEVTSDHLAELEEQMLPLFALPAVEQPIGQMLTAYRNLDREQLTAEEIQHVGLRIAALKHNQKVAETIRQIDQVQHEGEAASETGSEDHEETPGPVEYSVVGLLRASAMYSGETLPRLYRVLAGDGRTIGWIRPTSPVDTRVHLGQLVGIVGPKQYDDALKLHIFTVERIDLLEASE